jgi:hypothetical protein
MQQQQQQQLLQMSSSSTARVPAQRILQHPLACGMAVLTLAPVESSSTAGFGH